MKKDAFFIVWSPRAPNNPRKRHESFDLAAAEAGRLARANAGQDFYVMQAQRRVRAIDPVETEDFEVNLEVPF